MKSRTEFIDELKCFVENLITEVLCFTPTVVIEEQERGMFLVILDGKEIERRMMMGKEAKTFYLFKDIIRLYSRQRGYFISLQLKRDYGYY